MLCACVILNYNDYEQTESLALRIESITQITYIVIIDNKSTDNSYKRLLKLRNEKIYVLQADGNKGYGAGNNLGIQFAKELKCEYALIANPDVDFDENFVNVLLEGFIINHDAGIISGIQLKPNGTNSKISAERIQSPLGFIARNEGLLRRCIKKHFYDMPYLTKENYTKVDCVAGATLMVKIDAFMKCGGYDNNIFLYYEEIVIGCRMKNNGYKTYIASKCVYKHIHGGTTNKIINSSVKHKLIMQKSQKYVLKNYLAKNFVHIILNDLLSLLSLCETCIIQFVKNVKYLP